LGFNSNFYTDFGISKAKGFGNTKIREMVIPAIFEVL